MIPPVGAHDFPYLFGDQAASLFNLPLTWSPQSHDALGVFNLSTLWDWPYALLYGWGGKIGLNFTLSTLLFGILPAIIISWLTVGKLLQSYALSTPARRVGQLLFAANTYLLMLIDGGQLSLAVGYSLLPLAILYFPNRTKFILVTAAISFLDIRYLLVLFLPLFLHVVFHLRQAVKYLVTGMVTILVLAGLHGYWVLPAVLSKAPALPATYTRLSQVSDLSFATLAHTLFLIHPHWPKNIFGQIPAPSGYFFLVPILAFLPLAIYPKNRAVGYWAGLAVISAFLVKGSNPPLPQIYPWFFAFLPGFSLFRDPTKFFPLLTLSYAVLVAFSAEYLNLRHRSWPYVISGYLLLLVSPVLLGRATGLFSLPRDASAYWQVANFLKKDLSSGRIVWIPSKPSLGYSSPIHGSIDALTLVDRRPFATGVVGGYDRLNFLREASYSGQLLAIAGVKYLAIASVDPARDSLKPEDVTYHDVFTAQLARLPWIASRYNFGPVSLLQTRSYQNMVWLPSRTTFVVGPDDLYRAQSFLSDDALVFVEERPTILAQISRFPHAGLVLNRKSPIDVAAALLPASALVFPGQRLSFQPDPSGWWKRETTDLVWWRNFLQQKYALDNLDFDYGGGWAIAEGQAKLTLAVPTCPSACLLVVRAMTSSQGGELRFSQGDSLIGSLKTDEPDQSFTYSQASFSWHEIGPLVDNSAVSITTSGNINVLNVIAVVPTDAWRQYQRQAQDLINRSSPPVSSSLPSVDYTQHDPTHYTVWVKNLTGPATLVFSQNYDPLWELNGSPPVPVYSLVSGWPIPGSGEYHLTFSPQKYVRPGLVISLTTLVLLLLILSRSRLRLHHQE